MYNISYFREEDQQIILQFLNDHPFAFLTGSDSTGNPVATQVPMLLEHQGDDLILQGHIMRNTDHHKAFVHNSKVLAVFTGPNTYVSSRWYSKPGIASTWNYMSVHARGTVRFMSESELIEFMRKFTLRFEGGNQDSPAIYDNLPDEFNTSMIPMITGFEIKVEEIDNVFKLSQNREKESYYTIIKQLMEQGGDGELIAKEMEKRVNGLFGNDG